MTRNPALGPDGKRLEKLTRCTFLCWKNDDKIIRDREYAQTGDE